MAIRARPQSRPWRSRNANAASRSSQARVAPQGPRAFLLPSTGYWGRRAARFVPNAPLAESAYARVSETRDSGFESRVGYQSTQQKFCITRAGTASGNTRFALSQFGCGTTSSARAGLPRATPRGRSSIARAPALQAGRRRLDSDRLHQLAVAQLASAPRSGRGDRRFESCRRDQHHLRSSTERERAATDREMRVRILPGVPTTTL